MAETAHRTIETPPLQAIASWSNIAKTTTRVLSFCDDLRFDAGGIAGCFIPHGAGHSWGDAAFLTGGVTLASDRLRTIDPVDHRSLTVTAQSGVTMAELHAALEASGCRLAIYGGTHGVTLGGAAAADIHGKNHPHAGSFGEHIVSFDLMVASGTVLHCSRDRNARLFAATIGGMGLTGFIIRLTLKVDRGYAPVVRASFRSVASIDELLEGLDTPPAGFAIGDWLRPGCPGSRGLLTVARSLRNAGRRAPPRAPSRLPLPRINIFNRFTTSIVDVLLHRWAGRRDILLHMRRFNHGGPHEHLAHWNRLFGRAGVIEYHCAVPSGAFRTIWTRLCRGQGGPARPRFAVIKRFGTNNSPGLLSFPVEGYSLNFHADDNAPSRHWLIDFGAEITRAGGRIYLAKDAVATAEQIAACYPRLGDWREIVREVDPAGRVRSDLSDRLGLKPW